MSPLQNQNDQAGLQRKNSRIGQLGQLDKRIILFDGECGLCHFSVKFVLRNDKQKLFYFAKLNSDLAKTILAENNVEPGSLTLAQLARTHQEEKSLAQTHLTQTSLEQTEVENQSVEVNSQKNKQLGSQSQINSLSASVVLYKNNKIYFKAKAVQEILYDLNGIYLIFYVILKLTPLLISNFIYDLIAKNRYRFFTQKNYCDLLDESVRDRFL